MRVEALLRAARATQIPAGESGLWFIKKLELGRAMVVPERGGLLSPGIYTFLLRTTWSTLHIEPYGEVVMEDTPYELRKHLQFMLVAQGRVLVTGLGLGCVVRGLLANPKVCHVTCVENSPDVLKLVGPYMPAERLTIIEADALEWTCENRTKFDFAWHDIWTDKDAGEPHLDLWHTRLLSNCAPYVTYQGAWSYDRGFKRLLQRRGRVRLIG